MHPSLWARVQQNRQRDVDPKSGRVNCLRILRSRPPPPAHHNSALAKCISLWGATLPCAARRQLWKKWTRWFLVVGSHERDKLFAAALKRAAHRFGAKIVQEREFTDTGVSRRTDSGVVQIQQQMPFFTQIEGIGICSRLRLTPPSCAVIETGSVYWPVFVGYWDNVSEPGG